MVSIYEQSLSYSHYRLAVERFHNQLPIFVKVTRGHYGENVIDTVTQDEVNFVK